MILDNLSEKEKGYLFGLFEGDGYKYHDKKRRHYHVEFYLNSIKDKRIIKCLINLLKKIGKRANLYQDKRYNCKRVRVYSKDLFNILKRGVILEKKSIEFNIGFVSGLIDSEGHVSKVKNYIMIVNTNKEVLDKVKRFLDSISIKSGFNQRNRSIRDKLPSYRMYISVKFKRLNHLSIKAGDLLTSRYSGVETSS